MKTRVSKMLTAAVLLGFGFGLGFFMAPTTAQSGGCISLSNKSTAASLTCPGSYEIMASPQAGTDITGCQIRAWGSRGKVYHSAIITVVNK